MCEGFLGWDCCTSRPCSVGLVITHLSLFLFLCYGYQMLGEASPVNIVSKLNQLISLLSSIEEKVVIYIYIHIYSYFMLPSYHLLLLVMLLLCLLFIISAILCNSKISLLWLYCSRCSVESPNAIQYTQSLLQVKTLLIEGPDSTHRRSLIPPVTFEVNILL